LSGTTACGAATRSRGAHTRNTQVVYAGVHTHMLPDLRPGAWVLLEFTNRGEMLK